MSPPQEQGSNPYGLDSSTSKGVVKKKEQTPSRASFGLVYGIRDSEKSPIARVLRDTQKLTKSTPKKTGSAQKQNDKSGGQKF